MLQAAESRLQEPFLFAGDWNTGAHRLDETGKTFVCAEHFGRLSTLGWTDMILYSSMDDADRPDFIDLYTGVFAPWPRPLRS